MKKHTVLFLEWSTYGREFEIDLPLMYFFENKLGWRVEYKSQFNLPSIINTNPDIVIMSGSTGADRGLKWTRTIEESNILLFTHVTEGMFRESDIEEFVWGWGKKEKRFSETLSMLWTHKSYDMAIKAFPNTEKTYRVSGAVGFDKYKIFEFNKISDNKYNKVIGYAAFDFNNIMDKKDYFIKTSGEEKFNIFTELINKTNEILEYIIQNNNDILFLLKPHPGDGGREPLEFKNLLKYDNVRSIKNKVSILDVIASSDIWLNINSSTNLESWLLDKPSISFILNEDMYSSDILYGSVIENSPKEIQNMINEFYSTKSILRFSEKENIRLHLIKNYMGFSDGMNHVRFMSFLKPYIEKIEKEDRKKVNWNISLNIKIIGYIKHFIYTISNGRYWLPYLNKWSSIYERCNNEDIEKAKNIHYPKIDKFYEDNQEKINNLYNNYESEFNKCVE